ncbi:hypothetical protein ACFYXP_24295 [Streptomyces sp. NPDC002466]|uniref:hypothetical protein n=1 Tax=Streptomyces sp. NPDC002466 TaxID=3364646 RepID=UPI0036C6A899
MGEAGVFDGVWVGALGAFDGFPPEEGVYDGGRVVCGEVGEDIEGEDIEGEGFVGEGEGEGTGDGVVAGTVVPGLSGSSEATPAPAPERTRQAPTASATIRRR